MKFLKPLYFASVVAILLTGCKTINTIPVPLGTNNAVIISAKKAPLTKTQKQTWGHADLATDTIPGMSIEKAYAFLKGKKGVEVIVGVVDSGTDLKHEDLSAVAWVNKKEIPNNGKDDDKNGYVDDINGWNFLGPIFKENAEVERILKNPKLVDEATYKSIKEAQDKKTKEASANKFRFNQILQAVQFADKTITDHLKKKTYTLEDLNTIKSDNPGLMQSVNIAKQMFGLGLNSLSQAITEIKKEIKNAEDLMSGDNLKTDYRKALGDNAQNFSIKFYGDNKTGHTQKKKHMAHMFQV